MLRRNWPIASCLLRRAPRRVSHTAPPPPHLPATSSTLPSAPTPPYSVFSPAHRLHDTALRRTMTSESTTAAAPPANITSPPTSPPAKRVKTTEGTVPIMAESSSNGLAAAAPVTKLADQPPLLVKKLSDKARLPTRGSAFAAGYDLYAAKDTVIPARGKALVDTDISMAVPAGTYGRIAPRSGLASKHFIDTGAGVIDADYRGQVKVLLFNHAEADFEVKGGDRIAQLVLERIYTPDVVEVQELEESVRGAGGFGSTG